MAPIRLLLVDDHRLVRQGIRSLLEMEADLVVAGEAETGQKALELARELNPDLVLLDIQMPDIEGSAICRRLLAQNPHLPIVMLTVRSDHEDVLRCIRAGARGYLLKDADVAELVRTIRAVHAGEAVLDSRVTAVVFDELRRTSGESNAAGLSQREREILRLASQGLTNRQIGERLFLSVSTVKVSIGKIMEKLGVTSRTALVHEATKRGLI